MKDVWKKVAILCVALAATLYVQDALGTSLEDEAWATACDITRECTGVAAPVVVRSNLIFASSPWYVGVLGLHLAGEPYVYIRSDMEGGLEYVALVHEMTHYINGVRGFYQGNACANEASAFAVADEAAIRIDRVDLIRGETWRASYRGCEARS